MGEQRKEHYTSRSSIILPRLPVLDLSVAVVLSFLQEETTSPPSNTNRTAARRRSTFLPPQPALVDDAPARPSSYRRSTTFHGGTDEFSRLQEMTELFESRRSLKRHASMDDAGESDSDDSDNDTPSDIDDILEDLAEEEPEAFSDLPRLVPTYANLSIVNTFSCRDSTLRLSGLSVSPKADRRLRQRILKRMQGRDQRRREARRARAKRAAAAGLA